VLSPCPMYMLSHWKHVPNTQESNVHLDLRCVSSIWESSATTFASSSLFLDLVANSLLIRECVSSCWDQNHPVVSKSRIPRSLCSYGTQTMHPQWRAVFLQWSDWHSLKIATSMWFCYVVLSIDRTHLLISSWALFLKMLVRQLCRSNRSSKPTTRDSWLSCDTLLPMFIAENHTTIWLGLRKT
jgi:hypothetical protein